VPTALITCAHLWRNFGDFASEYEQLGVTAVLPELAGQQFDARQMATLIEGVEAVIAGDDVIDRSVLEAGAPSLKAVIKWGVGVDAIDTRAAVALGIPVFNTPGVFADEVADLAMSHLLMLARRTHRLHASVLAGEWLQLEGRSLAGLTAGVIGLGSVGSAIARRAVAFGMDVVGYDVRVVPAEEHRVPTLRQAGLRDVFRACDVLFLACQLTAESHHLVSREAINRMREGVLIVNVARGPLIDQEALVDALASGKVGGVGLDVFEEEPLPGDDPLRRFADRCVFTTHNGSSTSEAVARTNRVANDVLFHVLGLKPAASFTPNRVA
jgi:D-3-phosphoglycerate dehydrogenase